MGNKDSFYAELIDMLKKKDQKKDKSFYQELELPIMEPQQIENMHVIENEIDDRGVLVLDLLETRSA